MPGTLFIIAELLNKVYASSLLSRYRESRLASIGNGSAEVCTRRCLIPEQTNLSNAYEKAHITATADHWSGLCF